MQRTYKELIFTDHALERLKEREIKQSDAWATWRNPDKSRFSESRGGRVYTRNFGSQELEIVAKQNNEGKWVVISVWSKDKNEPRNRRRDKDRLITGLIEKLFRNF